jgi:hypothetical protein
MIAAVIVLLLLLIALAIASSLLSVASSKATTSPAHKQLVTASAVGWAGFVLLLVLCIMAAHTLSSIVTLLLSLIALGLIIATGVLGILGTEHLRGIARYEDAYRMGIAGSSVALVVSGGLVITAIVRKARHHK